MGEEKIIVQFAKPERHFTKVYNDFLYCDLLTVQEKLVYIALKSFVTYGEDSGQAYPSMQSLCKITNMTRQNVTNIINRLVRKKVITKQRRGLTKTNLYTLNDNELMWKSETLEEMQLVAENALAKVSDEEMIAELAKRGYEIKTKKEELIENTVQSISINPSQVNHYSTKDNIITDKASQERYTLDYLKKHFQYSIMCDDYPDDISLINYLLQIIYDTVNSNKETVRVAGEDKVKEVVVSVLMKLTHEELMYVIEKYKQQANRIKYPEAYLLTQLYKAKGQMDADIINQVQNDLYGSEQ